MNLKDKTIAKSLSFGFTLIELLVVMAIIGVLSGLSLFAMQGAKASSRDARRKSDLELIRSGLEMYKADCGTYPTTLSSVLLGKDATPTSSCSTSNVYIGEVPTDPQYPTKSYRYDSDGVTYTLCSSLEQNTGSSVSCGGSSTNCGGGTTGTCYYKVVNP